MDSDRIFLKFLKKGGIVGPLTIYLTMVKGCFDWQKLFI